MTVYCLSGLHISNKQKALCKYMCRTLYTLTHPNFFFIYLKPDNII